MSCLPGRSTAGRMLEFPSPLRGGWRLQAPGGGMQQADACGFTPPGSRLFEPVRRPPRQGEVKFSGRDRFGEYQAKQSRFTSARAIRFSVRTLFFAVEQVCLSRANCLLYACLDLNFYRLQCPNSGISDCLTVLEGMEIRVQYRSLGISGNSAHSSKEFSDPAATSTKTYSAPS